MEIIIYIALFSLPLILFLPWQEIKGNNKKDQVDL